CRCAMCALVRPDDPDVVDRLIGDLRGDNIYRARSAAQILGNMDIARPDVLLALVATTPDEHYNDFPERAALVESYSCYVAEAWSLLRPMLPRLTGDECNMAVVALMPHYGNQPADVQAAFLTELADASREDGRNSVVAGNYLRILGGAPGSG